MMYRDDKLLAECAPQARDGDDLDDTAPPSGRLAAIRNALFPAMIVGRNLSDEQFAAAEGLALEAARNILATEQAATWDGAARATIGQLRRSSRLGQPVRVVAQIERRRDPERYSLGGTDFFATTLRLAGTDGEEMETLGIVGDDWLEKIDGLDGHGLVEVLGRAVAVPTLGRRSRSKIMLDVVDVRVSTSNLDLIGATTGERRDAEALLQEIRRTARSPIDYMIERLRDGLAIVGLDDLPALALLIRLVVLQALAVDRISQASGKISILIIGPPAHGKKLIGLAARALNPISQTASPSKITPAGLVGSSTRQADGWHSAAGVIAKAHGGVVIIQDAHGISDGALRKIAPILQEVLEDGALNDTVAGGRRRMASVGFVIDLNRMSQVATGFTRRDAAILGLRPLLSRVDVIIEIAPDPELAWRVAQERYAKLTTAAEPLDTAGWARHLRVLVAALRDRHPEVDLDPVTEQMAMVHQQINVENAEMLAALPEAGDIPARMVNSFARLVAAAARANDRAVATEDDVREAAGFLKEKLKYFHILLPTEHPEAATTRGALASSEAAIRDRISDGRIFTATDLVQVHEEVTGELVSERTARRWLKILGAKRVGHGEYERPEPIMREQKILKK